MRLDSDGEVLFERLRDWRRGRASSEAVSPFIVASDAMLRDLVTARPGTVDGLGQVKGFGPNRIEKYGDELLAILAE